MASLNVALARDAVQVDETDIVDIGHESAEWQELLNELNANNPWDPLCDAILRGDELGVRDERFTLKGTPTYPAKIQAISSGRRDFLRLLLEADDSLDDSIVAKACEENDFDSIRLLIEFGWPINAPVRLVASLLCLVVHSYDFMDELLQAGADVNIRNAVDESVLSMAIAHGTLEVTYLLLEKGADIRHGDLLHHAAMRSNQEEGEQLVKELIQKGLDVNAYQYDTPRAYPTKGLSVRGTPLHTACANRNLPVARTLLAYGANPRQNALTPRKASDSPLDRALATGNEDLISLLRDYDRGRSQL